MSQNQTRKLYQVFVYIFLCQNDTIFKKLFELCQVFVRQNVSVRTNFIQKKHYSVKIGSISFLLSSSKQKFYHLLRCHAIDINSLLKSFLSTLRFSNLIWQAKRLIKVIVSRSSSS